MRCNAKALGVEERVVQIAFLFAPQFLKTLGLHIHFRHGDCIFTPDIGIAYAFQTLGLYIYSRHWDCISTPDIEIVYPL